MGNARKYPDVGENCMLIRRGPEAALERKKKNVVLRMTHGLNPKRIQEGIWPGAGSDSACLVHYTRTKAWKRRETDLRLVRCLYGEDSMLIPEVQLREQL